MALPKKTPSDELAAVIGHQKVTMTDAVKKFWDYVKKYDLQDPSNRRNILTGDDDELYALTGKKKITMFEVGGIINENLS